MEDLEIELNNLKKEKSMLVKFLKDNINSLNKEMVGTKGSDRYSYKQELNIYKKILSFLELET